MDCSQCDCPAKRSKGASDPIVYKSLWLITQTIRDRDRLRYHVPSQDIIVIIVGRHEPTADVKISVEVWGLFVYVLAGPEAAGVLVLGSDGLVEHAKTKKLMERLTSWPELKTSSTIQVALMQTGKDRRSLPSLRALISNRRQE